MCAFPRKRHRAASRATPQIDAMARGAKRARASTGARRGARASDKTTRAASEAPEIAARSIARGLIRLAEECADANDALGAIKALETLSLRFNKIGDEGVRHLGDALARGAAPALKELRLRDDNPASDAAQQAVEDAIKQRASRE